MREEGGRGGGGGKYISVEESLGRNWDIFCVV